MVSTRGRHQKAATSISQSTSTAMIMKTTQCKRIVYSNGTVHEIYYDDDNDKREKESPTITNACTSSKYQKHHAPRKRLYDIIRFNNGDIKMTMTTAINGSPKNDMDHSNKETTIWEEMYYYYSKSGIIQIARHPAPTVAAPRTATSTATTTVKHSRHNTANHASHHSSTIEYHYPNGQIEYYFGKERVVQFPDGRIRSYNK
jgi:hypothetical protein